MEDLGSKNHCKRSWVLRFSSFRDMGHEETSTIAGDERLNYSKILEEKIMRIKDLPGLFYALYVSEYFRVPRQSAHSDTAIVGDYPAKSKKGKRHHREVREILYSPTLYKNV